VITSTSSTFSVVAIATASSCPVGIGGRRIFH
jgi:hypothetical protein